MNEVLFIVTCHRSFGVVCVTGFFQVLVLSPQPQSQGKPTFKKRPPWGAARVDPRDDLLWLMPFPDLSVDLAQLILFLFLLTLTSHRFHRFPGSS